MAERKPFLLRMDPEVYAALQRWAADDLRSLNAQIEFVLRRVLQQEGRLRQEAPQALDALTIPPAPGATEGEGG
ncbi:MAG: hypothetical protein ABSB58_06430 [Gemmatimonadales bacterium]